MATVVDTVIDVSKVLDKLAILVRKDGRTLGELSRASGVAKSAISRLLRKERGLGFDAAEALADVIGCTIKIEAPVTKAGNRANLNTKRSK